MMSYNKMAGDMERLLTHSEVITSLIMTTRPSSVCPHLYVHCIEGGHIKLHVVYILSGVDSNEAVHHFFMFNTSVTKYQRRDRHQTAKTSTVCKTSSFLVCVCCLLSID